MPLPRSLISADSHVMEPLDLWTRHLPADLRAAGPRVEMRDGATFLMVEDLVVRRFGVPQGREAAPDAAGGATPAVGASAAADPAPGSAKKVFIMGANDPDARLRDLDADGVWGEVMYPNLGFFCCFRIESPALQVATAAVYNDWVADTFIGTSDRFAPAAIIPVLDIAASVAELERVAVRGFRLALLPSHIDVRPYNDPAYAPLWSAAEALGMPLSFHAGTGRTQTPAHGPGGAVVNYVLALSGPMETAAYLCGAGILARHPDLHVAMDECGSGWLAWALSAMDDAYREHHMFVQPKLELLPSEYFRRQGFVTFQHDPVGFANIPFTGDQCLMWGSDYPHPEGTWPNSHDALARQLAGVRDETIERVVCGNAARLYRFRVPESAGRA